MREEKQKMEHRLLRRLETRERFRLMLAEAAPSKERPELARLQAYLLDWSRHQAAIWSKSNQGIAQCTLAQFMKAGQSAIEHLDSSDAWAFQVLDASMDDLVDLPQGMLMRAALRVRYLNEGIDPGGELKIRVFRSGRLQNISLMEVDGLADSGENALISIVKRRGLPL